MKCRFCKRDETQSGIMNPVVPILYTEQVVEDGKLRSGVLPCRTASCQACLAERFASVTSGYAAYGCNESLSIRHESFSPDEDHEDCEVYWPGYKRERSAARAACKFESAVLNAVRRGGC